MMTVWPGILPLVFPKRYSHFGSDYNRTLHTVISWNAPDSHDPKETQPMVLKINVRYPKEKKKINISIKAVYLNMPALSLCGSIRVTLSIILCTYSSPVACIS